MHEHSPPDLYALPADLRDRVSHDWQRFAEAARAAKLEFNLQALGELGLPTVWACSDFVAQGCIRQPEVLRSLIDSGDLTRPYSATEPRAQVDSALADAHDEKALASALRRLRLREMMRIAWRDLAGWADLEETMRELSWFAEACIDGGLARLHEWQQAEFGTPCDAEGRPQNLVVIGMGKLGAGELNFSSDIDLIFAFAEHGETQGGRRALSNSEYFTRLGQGLIGLLGQSTAEGFVFRVDMRLRPFGESGPLVASFDAMEHYYQTHGRGWERYAMIKARVVGGDYAAGAELMAMLRPFVYRRYLDYSAFESLRELKQRIAAEVARRGREHNIKTGPGGIREIEFVGQAFQLIRGGREPELQEPGIQRVLARLAETDYLPAFVVDELDEAYVFLRRLEHRLQELADQQTHDLPADAIPRARIAFAMGEPDWDSLVAELERHRTRVQAHFEQVFEAPQTEQTQGQEVDLQGIWLGSVEDERAAQVLLDSGYDEVEEPLRRLRLLREGHAYRSLSTQARRRMDRLMPLVLGVVTQFGTPAATLLRLLDLLERVTRRTAYLSLLVENPMALSQLARLCAASPWIAKYLAVHPLLLDELLDPRNLYYAPGRQELIEDLRGRLAGLGEDDLEQAMDALRHFKQSATLRVAAADISGAMPLMVVSDHLTWIAEAVVDEVLELAWNHLVHRHGRPRCSTDTACDKGFAVVAYGKLGGIELSYSSDLDLVFLHGAESELLETDGPKPVVVPVFFGRLGQRIIHILTSRTPAGVLYEVDTRLRPNGNAGLLVSGLKAFGDYQRGSAWTWEHQALVRARVVAGDPAVAEAFATLRAEILSQRRDVAALRREVHDMRTRMRDANSKSRGDEFDLKQDAGGIADIEFMVQYGVLAWACDHPELLDYTDNIRLLAAFAQAGLLAESDVALLSDAYRAYRARVHQLTLQERTAIVGTDEFAAQRARVISVWQALMEQAD